MSKRKGFKLNVGFITGVFAVCAVSIATGYFLKNASISASTTDGSAAQTALEYSNASALQGSTLWSNAFGGDERNRSCAASTGLASKEELPLTDSEKEKYGDTAKAYLVKINGKISEFRLVMSASRVPDINDSNPSDGKQTDAMIEYTLTYLNDPRLPNAESRGGNGDNITIIYNNAGFVKTYNTLVKNDPWDDFIKAKDAYTYFEQTGSKDFSVSVHFKGKNNDGCIAGIDLKDALVASATPAVSVTPTVEPSQTPSVSSTVIAGGTTTAVVKQSLQAEKTLSDFRGCYYTAKDFSKFVGARNDKIDFAWGNGPATSKTGSDNFSVKWAGDFNTTNATSYTFKTIADDGVRVWVNNTLVIDAWTKGKKTSTGVVDLPAGKFPIKVEYYEEVGNAEISLTWAAKDAVKTPGAQAKVTHSSAYVCDGQTVPSTSPTVTASATATSTPIPGYDYAGDEALNMTLKVEPVNGKLPLTVNATANLGGTTTGNIHWKMYCGNVLPNMNTGIVKADKDVTDLKTTQTLSCTYESKRSFRLFVTAEREGKRVMTKTWIKAGFIPLSENQEKKSIDIKKGFNVFGSELASTALKFQTDGKLTVFRFNFASYKKWLRWPEQRVNFNIQPGKGYYLYSAEDKKVNIVMRKAGDSLNSRKLFPGWNMVWVKEEHDGLKGVLATISMSDSKNPLNKGTNKCLIEKQDLQELVDKGVAYKYVYIIDNGNATEPCETFKLLETGSARSGCDKINAAKTVTTTSKCSACSLDITDKLPAGSVFWVYIYESKLKEVKGAVSALATATASAATAGSISLSGQMCK